MRVFALVLVAALLLAAPAFGSEQHPTQSEVEAALVCPTCHLPLDESNSPVAQQLKERIRVEIAAGWTRSRILNGFVRDFGSSILSEPPRHGFDLLAWVLPIGGALAGAVALAGGAWVWSRGRERDGPDGAVVLDGPPLYPELDRRVDEELARFDG